MTTPDHITCHHCDLRFEPGTGVSDDNGDFCCVGCHAVYHTLHEAGFENFYALRHSWSEELHPVDADVLHKQDFDLFDSPDFLDTNAPLTQDGTRQIELHLDGVHCAGCVWLVEKMPAHLDGVRHARLELARRRITLRWDPDPINLSSIATWLTQFGFAPHPLKSDKARRRATMDKKMLVRLGICWAVAANIMLMSITLYAGLDPVTDGPLHAAVLFTLFALSTVSLIVGGSFFFRRAWLALKSRTLSMDVPIALGILVGYTHSTIMALLGSSEVWFDSIAVLTAALLSARYLQMRGNSVAADAAERLVSLLPQQARKVLSGPDLTNIRIEAVPAESLKPGDRIEVRAGDIVPADGYVISGTSKISRAVLTGESRPEAIESGAFVEAGTTNLASPIYIDATAVGVNTRVGQLMQWVRNNDQHRAPIVQLADRFSKVFIAFVLLAALATAIAWASADPSRAVVNVVALLVIACPCALGMATPLALSVGIGQAARRGIHIKNDDVIEALHHLTDVVFDKTGTLTVGRPTVVDTFGNLDFLKEAAPLERFSRHPLAEAILRWAGPVNASLDNVEEIPGTGIRGLVNGTPITIGRLSSFDEVPDHLASLARQKASEGLTPVAVGRGSTVEALFAIGDALRPEAKSLIDNLHARGIHVHLLSGDHRAVVQATAQQLHIPADFARGEASPEQKLARIKELTANPDARVAMVGDGVNDAAALQAATIGIAVHGGAEASLVAADVFLVKTGIKPVQDLLVGSKHIMTVVHRNLIGSALYNLFGISLAALGCITPLAAAILMPISSLAVVTSSLIQRSFRPPEQSTPPVPLDLDQHSTSSSRPLLETSQ